MWDKPKALLMLTRLQENLIVCLLLSTCAMSGVEAWLIDTYFHKMASMASAVAEEIQAVNLPFLVMHADFIKCTTAAPDSVGDDKATWKLSDRAC